MAGKHRKKRKTGLFYGILLAAPTVGGMLITHVSGLAVRVANRMGVVTARVKGTEEKRKGVLP